LQLFLQQDINKDFDMMCAALKVLQIVLELRPTSSFVAIFGQVQRFLEKWIFSDKPALIEAVAAVMVPIYRTIPIVEQGALQGSAATSEAKTFQSEAAHFRSVIDSGIFDRIQNGKQLSSALSHISAMARAASPSSGGSNTTSIDRFIPDLVKLVGVRLLPSIFFLFSFFLPPCPPPTPTPQKLASDYTTLRTQPSANAPGHPHATGGPTAPPGGSTVAASQLSQSPEDTPIKLLPVLFSLLQGRLAVMGDQRKSFLTSVLMLVDQKSEVRTGPVSFIE